MRQILFQMLILIFLNSSLLAQKSAFSISGNVTDCNTHKLIPNANMNLTGSDGTMIYIETDDLGNYLFDSLKLKSNRKYILRVMAPPTGKYLNCSERYQFDTFDTISRHFVNSFCLVPQTPCNLGYIKIYFEKNSDTKYDIDTLGIDVEMYAMLMIDNPTLVIEINSNSSFDENNPDMLSKKRAEFLKEILIKKGINKDRIIIKAMGITKPVSTKEQIGKLKSLKEKEEANKQNRRTVFLIIRKDFPTEPQKNKVIESNESDEGE